MSTPTNPKNRPPKPTVPLVTEALNLAAQDAVEAHRRANQPLAVWKDGKTVLVSPHSGEPLKQPQETPREKPS